MKILANDGIDSAGRELLKQAGFTVDTTKIAQDELLGKLKNYDGIIVRSATMVRESLMDACGGNLKFIGRAGVGLDNIDVEAAKTRNILVFNTPAASSLSVAELVFAHLFGLSRFMHRSNRELTDGSSAQFNRLKKEYAAGWELSGKTLGIIGFGRIGQEVGRIGRGIGMKVVVYDVLFQSSVTLAQEIEHRHRVGVASLDEVLCKADCVSLHTPDPGKPIIDAEAIARMKRGAVLINCSRGGIIDEEALLDALDSGQLLAAGLDVFSHEPTPNIRLLNHPRISVSPHIGASTTEAQERVGIEMARRIIEAFPANNA
ncbi:MAG: 3-phosphoglycerate dehydrogenase [Sphingomonadales bacterium]|nr:3-phosphoglycerate dehydrogenase [Sphingomonadales bacterium]